MTNTPTDTQGATSPETSTGTTAAAPNGETRVRQVVQGRGRAWSGLGFSVLFFAGMLPLGDLLGSFGDSDATFVAFFEQDDKRIGTLVGGFTLALAALGFLWFLSHLRDASNGAGSLPSVVTTAGTTFTVLLMAGAAALVTVPYARTVGDAFDDEGILAGSDALLPQLGYVLVTGFGMWAFAATVVAVTVGARRHGTFPRWLVRVGFASAAFVFLFGWSVGGLLAVPVWSLSVSIHWLREARNARVITS